MWRRVSNLSSDIGTSRHQSESFCWRIESQTSRESSVWTTKSFLATVDSTWWERSSHSEPTPKDSTVDPALSKWNVKSHHVDWFQMSFMFGFNAIFRVWSLILSTCGYRYSPRQPIAMCLIGVIEPEVIVRSRKSVGELNRIADLSRWYRRIWRWISIRRVVNQPVKAILLFVHVGDFYHKVSTKAVLQ